MTRHLADDIVNRLANPPHLTPLGADPKDFPRIVQPVLQFIARHARNPDQEVELLAATSPIMESRQKLAYHLSSVLELVVNGAQHPELLRTENAEKIIRDALNAGRQAAEETKP